MKRKSFTFFLLPLALAALAIIPSFIGASIGVKAEEAKLAIGAPLEAFSLSDINSKTLSVKELKGAKGTVFVFLSAQCPVVKGYVERIQAVAKDYSGKGINFVGINSNSTEDLAWVKSNAEANFKFPVLIDTGNKVADKWGASVTPEVYFFDADGKLAYRGGIDNDRRGDNITKNYLRDALDNALAGKAIAEKETNAFGCTIKRLGQ
ncbi:MAG TPA: thioredoxin family protein [Pyrinomonadaceae bacterium]|jgi:peroxiredoxin|nr:thioredoxin family protein [Pyrinomonadaceae bacterium]